ncbi:MAG: HEAT repeat domain-containing protein [Candidatus Ranarchaeia archaeon]|jgi:HEAT repeat protein
MGFPFGSDLREQDGSETSGERRAFWSKLHALHLWRHNDRQEEKDSIFLSQPDCVAKLDDVLNNAEWDVMRAAAVRMLAKSDDGQVVSILKKGLFDRSFQIRLQSAQTLWDIGDKSGIPMILNELKAERKRNCCEAAAFLCSVGNNEGLAYVIEFLNEYQTSAQPDSDGRLYLNGCDHHVYNDLALSLAKIRHKDALSFLVNSPHHSWPVIDAILEISKIDSLPLLLHKLFYERYEHGSNSQRTIHQVLVELFREETTRDIYEAVRGSDEALSKLCNLGHPDITIVLQQIEINNEEQKRSTIRRLQIEENSEGQKSSTKKKLAEIQARLDKVRNALEAKGNPPNPLTGRDLLLNTLRFGGKKQTKGKIQKPQEKKSIT